MSSSMTKFSKVEDEALVECVAKNPPIYNPQNKDYKDLNIRDAIWKNISETVGFQARSLLWKAAFVMYHEALMMSLRVITWKA
ncbi:hypothetical protein QTP88_026732 [Uroleucon formosanum]